MRILFIVIFLAFVKESMAQESTRYYFPEIGWTIHLPLDFKVLNTEQESASIKRGKKGIAQALDTNVNLLETINLISAKKSRNYFNASLTANNSKSDAAAANFINSQEKAIYEAMSKSAKVDSSSTVLKVGGEPFRKFEMIVHLNEAAAACSGTCPE